MAADYDTSPVEWLTLVQPDRSPLISTPRALSMRVIAPWHPVRDRGGHGDPSNTEQQRTADPHGANQTPARHQHVRVGQTRCIDVLRCFVTDDDDLKGSDGELGVLDGTEYSYALMAHFDFVVLDRDHVPVLAVEFDGPTHDDPDVIARDYRKNRLCFIAGLPLLRIHDSHLQSPERVNLLEWIIRLWQDYKQRVPELLAERDHELAELSTDQSRDPHVLMDRPDLDVELIFQLEHPFPPTQTVAAELHRKHRIHVPTTHYEYRCTQACVRKGVTVHGEPLPELGGDDVVIYTCTLRCGDHAVGVGRYETAGIYPWYPPGGPEPLAGVLSGTPAGPWIGAGVHLARGMSFHDALRDVADWARTLR